METTLGDQSHLVANTLVGDQIDPIDANQEDDFDFEIGGDDNFDLTGEAGNEDGDLIDQVEVTQDYTDQPDMHQSQEKEPQASLTENDAEEDQDYDHQEVGASSPGPDSLPSIVELTQDFQNGIEKEGLNDSQNDLGIADQEDTEKIAETFSEEEISYEETPGEFADPDSTLQAEFIQNHDLVNAATSVDHVHEGDDLQDRTHETADNNAQDLQPVVETAQYVEVAEDSEPEEHVQPVNAAAEAEIDEARNDSAGATLSNNEGTGGVVAENLDQSNWTDEDDDHIGSNVGPIVTVSYRGQEYSMFSQSPEDDPDTYFLDGVESIHRPLSKFLEDVRKVISSEVEAGHELFARIDGLGLEFGESTTKDFLDQTTLAQIIEVNDKLSQNDGGSQHAELYIFLNVRSNPLQRFAELAKGADEGHGLSYFEQYYEESPADVSLFDEEEQHEVSHEIGSDYLSPKEPSGDNEEAGEGASNVFEAEHDHNPFQNDDQQLPLDDAAISEILEAETEPFETEAVDNTAEASSFEEIVNDTSDAAQEGDDNSFDIAARNVEVIDENNNFGDATSMVEQVETEMGEDWDHNDEVDAQGGLDTTAVEETTEEQTELLINDSEEGQERSDGETSFFYTRDCLAPNLCECNCCPSSGSGDVEGKADQPLSAVSSSTLEPMGSRPFLLSDADWENLMVKTPQRECAAADRQAQGSTANMPNDEDYLDLSQDTENQAVTTDANVAEQGDTQQRTTPNSSATATLNGEENGQRDEAAATQDRLDPVDQPSDPTNQDEDDEIDWNHEDDDDIGVADQNPTDLSPSSLSAKRNRQEDEDIDGLGDDSGMFSVRGAPRLEANNLPAAKRRRT
ncbi:hypothetical protein N0V82_000993 [Gnomoniopsis sp. IMI 355080]|nr:hypothetical protein N0V82_000993 [Gnomoniopsis sp. IMI 355080]